MSAESEDTGETCEECGLALTDGECLTDGCAGPTADSSASALMGDGTATESETPEQTASSEATDPAREHNSYLEGFEKPATETVDHDEYDFDELSDENRRRVMDGQEPVFDTDEAASEAVERVDSPADLDWHDFAAEYGFDQAGQGAQPRDASRSSLLLAFEVDSRITGSPEDFLQRALADASVPLVDRDPLPRYRFAKEVLAQ